MSEYIDWIEYYEYKKFSNIIKIDKGGFSQVYRANLKQSVFALKSFNVVDNSIVKDIVSELKLHRDVDFHDNILRFHGITTITKQTDSGHLKEYLLVLEYADEGTLSNYLETKFLTLNWEDKYRLAFQLSSAIECLHDEGVVHRDLHSKNILIHQGKIKLADFGLSKRIEETTKSGLKVFGVMPYMDPKRFGTAIYKKGVTSPEENDYKKSDVYSVGVLFWEFSSGKIPFGNYLHDNGHNAFLAKRIIKGLRESKVKDTPEEYYNLYTKCWDGDSNKRPTIQEVVTTLGLMIKLQQKQPHQESNSDNSNANFTTPMISQSSYKLRQDSIPFNRQRPYQVSNLTSNFALTDKQSFDFIEKYDEQFGYGIFIWELVNKAMNANISNVNVNNLTVYQQYVYLLGFLNENMHLVFPPPITDPVIMLKVLTYSIRRQSSKNKRNKNVNVRLLLRYFVSLNGQGISPNVIIRVTDDLFKTASLHEKRAYSNLAIQVNQISEAIREQIMRDHGFV